MNIKDANLSDLFVDADHKGECITDFDDLTHLFVDADHKGEGIADFDILGDGALSRLPVEDLHRRARHRRRRRKRRRAQRAREN